MTDHSTTASSHLSSLTLHGGCFAASPSPTTVSRRCSSGILPSCHPRQLEVSCSCCNLCFSTVANLFDQFSIYHYPRLSMCRNIPVVCELLSFYDNFNDLSQTRRSAVVSTVSSVSLQSRTDDVAPRDARTHCGVLAVAPSTRPISSPGSVDTAPAVPPRSQSSPRLVAASPRLPRHDGHQ